MSDANIQLIENTYAAFQRGDIPALLDNLSPDVSWGIVGRERDFPFAGIREGKAGAEAFFRLLNETQDVTRFTPAKFVAAGDIVFVWGDCDWTMRGNNVAGGNDWLHVFTIRDGRIVSWRGHQDNALLAEAWRAAPVTKLAAAG